MQMVDQIHNTGSICLLLLLLVFQVVAYSTYGDKNSQAKLKCMTVKSIQVNTHIQEKEVHYYYLTGSVARWRGLSYNKRTGRYLLL
jgi:hypothetical protein